MSTRISKRKVHTKNKIRKVSPYLAALLSLSVITVSGTVHAASDAVNIRDLQQAAPWAKQAIERAAEQQMILADKAGNFNPSATLTRGDLAYTLAQLLELNVLSSVQLPDQLFRDLDRNAEHGSYIRALQLAGIMNGYPDGTFRPAGLVTREELATTIIRALKAKGYDETLNLTKELSFKDTSDISAWALPSVQQAVKLGILKGDNGNFAPKRSTSRQEMAVIALRATEVIQALDEAASQGGTNPESNPDEPGKVTEVQGTTSGGNNAGNGVGNTNGNSGAAPGNGNGNGSTGGGGGSTPTTPTNPSTPSNPGTGNRAPLVISGGLPDQELTLDHAGLNLNVSTYFSDPDGDELQFSVIAGEETIVSSTVVEKVIRLVPQAAGETMLTIKAVDVQGASITAQLKVKVQPNTISRQFPDPHLAGAIAYWLQKNVDDPLTKDELVEALIQTNGGLYARNAGISDLTGVEIFKGLNVTEIDLSGNAISKADASGFDRLNWLDLSRNELTQINVTGLDQLEYLNLANNRLPLLDVTGIDSLQELHLYGNELVHLPIGVAGLSDLQYLDVSNNAIPLREEPDFALHQMLLQRLDMYDFDDAPPVLVEAPAGITAYVHGDEIEIDLAFMFEDEDDARSTLILLADSPDPQLADVRMVGQKLYVTALGTSSEPLRIEVKATDPLGRVGVGHVYVDLREIE
ncbi:S-layer homology domain-containing protein [Paenibacillus sp. PK1-4R]|uniref:S-layer homology domain-containing protein n=1 Tax=Paenibacillus sp. PK1-4R TaxID=3049075 RepID=UPI0025A1801E|nr:S-layer homology domain-containing protein [Paenibacillus sp. PK1-4R]WJM09906.1 S-layer homology domain-containing protein [Paenibacillus sp. PK1-4R]